MDWLPSHTLPRSLRSLAPPPPSPIRTKSWLHHWLHHMIIVIACNVMHIKVFFFLGTSLTNIHLSIAEIYSRIQRAYSGNKAFLLLCQGRKELALFITDKIKKHWNGRWPNIHIYAFNCLILVENKNEKVITDGINVDLALTQKLNKGLFYWF